MPTITIRDLPDDVINIHKGMAAATDRSFEAHLRYVLREVISRQTFACDQATPIFHRFHVIDYLKKFVAIFKEEPDYIDMPYRGLLWNAVYNWSPDESGKNAPWALKDVDKFFGMSVGLAPFEPLKKGQQTEMLGYMSTNKGNSLKKMRILLSEILDNNILQFDCDEVCRHEPCGWSDIPVGRQFIFTQCMTPENIGVVMTKTGDVEAEKPDGSTIACSPERTGYGLLPECGLPSSKANTAFAE